MFHLLPGSGDARRWACASLSVVPATVTLTFEASATKTVPVVPAIDGEPGAGVRDGPRDGVTGLRRGRRARERHPPAHRGHDRAGEPPGRDGPCPRHGHHRRARVERALEECRRTRSSSSKSSRPRCSTPLAACPSSCGTSGAACGPRPAPASVTVKARGAGGRGDRAGGRVGCRRSSTSAGCAGGDTISRCASTPRTGSASSASIRRRSRSPSGSACPCPHACSAPTVFAARRARTPWITSTVRRIGAALVRALPPGAARVLIGRDTRESGLWLERELAHGARACGAEVVSAGVDPDARRRLPHAIQRLHRRRRHLGVAQSVRRQRHQGVLRRRREVQRGARAARREHRGRRLVGGPAGRGGRGSRRGARRALPRPRARGAARPGRTGRRARGRRLRQRRDDQRGAAAVPRARVRRDVHRRRAGRPEHQPALRIDASRGAGAHGRSRAAIRLGVAFDGDGDRAIFVDERGQRRRRRCRHADVRAAAAGARAG